MDRVTDLIEERKCLTRLSAFSSHASLSALTTPACCAHVHDALVVAPHLCWRRAEIGARHTDFAASAQCRANDRTATTSAEERHSVLIAAQDAPSQPLRPSLVSLQRQQTAHALSGTAAYADRCGRMQVTDTTCRVGTIRRASCDHVWQRQLHRRSSRVLLSCIQSSQLT